MKLKACPIGIGVRILDTLQALHIFGDLLAQRSEVPGRRGSEFETPEEFVVLEPLRIIGLRELCAYGFGNMRLKIGNLH